MNKVAIFLANGFEEIEGLTVVDILRRAGIEITMVSITGDITVTGAHGIKVSADITYENADIDSYDMLVLPGGGPGTQNLKNFKALHEDIIRFNSQGKNLAAICAAPTVFGMLGLLNGKNACAYETCEDGLTGANVLRDEVVTDGNIITSRGMGTAIEFGLEIASVFVGRQKADEIGRSLMYRL